VTRIGTFTFSVPLWLYPAGAGWHFVTVPEEVSSDITDLSAGLRHGFGSVRVAVTVGGTSWRTSVFPQSGTGCYLLPMKKAVRTAEGLELGGQVAVHLNLVDL
jgi:hypothetical protein